MIWRDWRSSADIQPSLICASGEGAFLTSWQWRRLAKSDVSLPENVVVTVPDFLRYARILGTGRLTELVSLAGTSQAMFAASVSGVRSIGLLPRLARMDFWAIGEALLKYDVGLLGLKYRGPLALHANLTDMALFYDRLAFLERFARSTRRRPYGFHTTQLQKLLSALARTGLQPGVVSYLTSPGTAEADLSMIAYVVSRHPTLKQTRWIAEADSWPTDLAEIKGGHTLLGIGGNSQHPNMQN